MTDVVDKKGDKRNGEELENPHDMVPGDVVVPGEAAP